MTDRIGADAALSKLDGWAKGAGDRDTIEKTFRLADFKTAWSFMSAVALKAEQMDHHPEWFNVYNKLVVDLMTHDASGITENDTNLAKILNSL